MSKFLLFSLTLPATSFVFLLYNAAEEGLPSVTTLIIPFFIIGLLIWALRTWKPDQVEEA